MMRLRLEPKWTLAPLLALTGLCSGGGAAAEEERPLVPRGPENSGIGKDAYRERIRKKLREAQEKAAQEAARKSSKKKKKKPLKRKGKKVQPKSPFRALPVSGNRKIYTLEFDPKAKKKSTRAVGSFQLSNPGGAAASRDAADPQHPRVFEFPDAGKGRLKRTGEGVAEIVPPGGEGLKTLPQGKLVEPPAPKRHWWQKLLGRGRKKRGTPLSVSKERPLELLPAKGSPAGAGQKDSLLRRLRSEMFRQREQALRTQRERELPESRKPKAEAVDLGAAAAFAKTKSAHPAEPPASGTSAPAPAWDAGAGPSSGKPPELAANAARVRKGIERRFRRGLASKDLVERAWAFRYAAAYRRAEALPYLIAELQHDGTLAVLAAAGLGAVDQPTPQGEAQLLRHLSSKDSTLRQVCASALGYLRSRRALKPFAHMLKNDRHYGVRAACCEALGIIGEQRAGAMLKERLADSGEVQIVKAHAALALARLHDPAGKQYLVGLLRQSAPQMQALGLAGLAQMRGPDTAGYLAMALESRYEEVWGAAVTYFPVLGPATALPILRAHLRSPNPALRRRAALSLGFLGSEEGVAEIVEALRVGGALERQYAAGLLGLLGRRDQAPLLIAKLKDPQSSVRRAAAVALARLNAREALPALVEATRGARGNTELPPALRGSLPQVGELLVLLGSLRALRGEKEKLVLDGLPDASNGRWPAFEREMLPHQLELLKAYRLVEVLEADGETVGAVLKGPDGREALIREGEPVAAGFRLREIYAGERKSGRPAQPAWVTLTRSDIRVTLIAGKPPEVQIGRQTKKELRLK